MKQLRAVITVSLAVDFEEPKEGTWQDAAISALFEGLKNPHEGIIGEVIEPNVDSIEELES